MSETQPQIMSHSHEARLLVAGSVHVMPVDVGAEPRVFELVPHLRLAADGTKAPAESLAHKADSREFGVTLPGLHLRILVALVAKVGAGRADLASARLGFADKTTQSRSRLDKHCPSVHRRVVRVDELTAFSSMYRKKMPSGHGSPRSGDWHHVKSRPRFREIGRSEIMKSMPWTSSECSACDLWRRSRPLPRRHSGRK